MASWNVDKTRAAMEAGKRKRKLRISTWRGCAFKIWLISENTLVTSRVGGGEVAAIEGGR